MVEWHRGDPPRDRRLLLIATPKNLPMADMKPDIVVGHWHGGNDAFVPVETPYTRGPTRPELNVEWWAEIPERPEGVELRELTREDLLG
jgi:hypothetical protein